MESNAELIGVTGGQVTSRIPRPLTEQEKELVALLVEDAADVIADALAVAGRSLERDVLERPGFAGTARRVVREMVSAVVLIGANAGQSSASSSTGAQSDSVRWSNPGASRWGHVVLTDEQRERLELSGAGLPRGRFPRSRIARWLR